MDHRFHPLYIQQLYQTVWPSVLPWLLWFPDDLFQYH
nr:MAG TPA: protein of unknown function (DUF5372) [Caudoviricetes sp.]